jgi:hypothetical protein
MSVDRPEVIDIIGTDHLTGDVVLTISDHLARSSDRLAGGLIR